MATVARQRPAAHAFIAYRRILVPVDVEGRAAVTTACALAGEHGAAITALAVIEVPPALPLDAHMPENQARAELGAVEAIGDRHGVRVDQLVVHARRAGEAIVEAAEELDAELVVLRRALDKTARYVLRHAPCRVLFSRP
jgi:basic amino acid/polyamine antiporter, APA family